VCICIHCLPCVMPKAQQTMCACVTLQAQQLLARLSASQHHVGADAFAGLGGLLSPEQAAAVAAVQQQQQQQQQQQAVQAAMLQVWGCSSHTMCMTCPPKSAAWCSCTITRLLTHIAGCSTGLQTVPDALLPILQAHLAGMLSPQQQQQQLMMMGLFDGGGGTMPTGVTHTTGLPAFPAGFPVSAAMANGSYGGFAPGGYSWLVLTGCFAEACLHKNEVLVCQDCSNRRHHAVARPSIIRKAAS
jgi:hypothetical protein